jgi:putative ABC transport system permease protein
MVLRQGVVLAVGGLALGLIASVGVARGLSAVFPAGPGGAGGMDSLMISAVALSVLAVTLIAAFVPARRASLINPTDALRFE